MLRRYDYQVTNLNMKFKQVSLAINLLIVELKPKLPDGRAFSS